MIDENEFLDVAEKTQERLLEALEEADDEAVLDVEIIEGTLTIILPDGKQYLVSRHAPSRQLWISSPLSGGLHFSFAGEGKWVLADGRELSQHLAHELKALTSICIEELIS